MSKFNYKRIDDGLLELAKAIVLVFLVYVIYSLCYKQVVGQWMMYEDYYDKKDSTENINQR